MSHQAQCLRLFAGIAPLGALLIAFERVMLPRSPQSSSKIEPTSRISIAPDSPKPGSRYRVSYDFSLLSREIEVATLHIYNYPAQPGDPQVLEISRDPEASISFCEAEAPPGGLGQIIEDDLGFSTAFGVFLL